MSGLEPDFREFDVTLKDGELDDFLNLMEQQHQSGPAGGPAEFDPSQGMPTSLPLPLLRSGLSAASLQLQPHSADNSPAGSPSPGEASEDSGARAPTSFASGGSALAFHGQLSGISTSTLMALPMQVDYPIKLEQPAPQHHMPLGSPAATGMPALPAGVYAAGTLPSSAPPLAASAMVTSSLPLAVHLNGQSLLSAMHANGQSLPYAMHANAQSLQPAMHSHGQPGQLGALPGAPPTAAGASGARPAYVLLHPQQVQAAQAMGRWPQAFPASTGAASAPATHMLAHAQLQALMAQQGGPAATLGATPAPPCAPAHQPSLPSPSTAASPPMPPPPTAAASSAAAAPPPPKLASSPAAAKAPCGGGAGSGGGISHSTVEKQRRDRLNNLIEELGDLVPPSDPRYSNAPAASEANGAPGLVRRPKHVVLSDAIGMLREMQERLRIDEARLSGLRQQVAAATAAAAGAGAAAADAATAAAGGGAGPTPGVGSAAGVRLELPTPPESGGTATGVVVEQGQVDNSLYVKVSCRDRKGLLCDLVGALRALPVIICGAAITTTHDGKVHDVFEVRLEGQGVTAEDVQCAVHTALYSAALERSTQGKRIRSG